MRCLCSLAAIASFLVISWNAPLRAEDESARRAKILEQVAQTLDQAELPAEAKQAVLRNLKISLAKALDGTVEVQKSATEEQMQDQTPDDEAVTDADAEDAAATQDRRDRSRPRQRAAQREQRREQRREPSRDPAAESRRAVTPPDEPERQRRRPVQDYAAQPSRYAIGVMLEKAEESDAEGKLVITDVFPGSPAAEADLRSGDVIRKLNGEELTDPSDVTERVNQAGADDKPLSLEIGRSDEVLTVEVKPSPLPFDGGAFGFGRPDWAFPALPGMPGFGGWRDPQWRFPTPPQTPPQDMSTERAQEIIQRIERAEQMIEQMRQTVEELRKQPAAELETEGDNADDDDSEED